MSTIKSMGDLRMFLVETMQGVRAGTVNCEQAGQVAKLAAQINASIHAEIAARSHLEVNERRAFSGLALIEAHDETEKPEKGEAPVDEGADDIDAEQPEPAPDFTDAELRISVPKPRRKSHLTDADWPEIKEMLLSGRDRKAIASDYDEELEDLDFFIASCQRREAKQPSGEARAPLPSLTGGAS